LILARRVTLRETGAAAPSFTMTKPFVFTLKSIRFDETITPSKNAYYHQLCEFSARRKPSAKPALGAEYQQDAPALRHPLY
jgi:hypothetical protein